MPSGTITYTTRAPTGIEDTSTTQSFPAAGRLQAGTNVVAVEVHPYNAASSDLHFELALRATRSASATPTQVVRQYYYAGSQRVALREGTVLYNFLSDHLGSTTITTDSAGAKVAELRYTPWGEGQASGYVEGDTPTDYRFTGQREEAEVGLYFYQARWYDAQLGRFLQADTVIPNPLDPLSYDRYAYVSNNPINAIDPSGHREIRDGKNVQYKNIYNSPKPLLGSSNSGTSTNTTKSNSSVTPANIPTSPSALPGGPRIPVAPTQTPTFDPFPFPKQQTATPNAYYSAGPTSTPTVAPSISPTVPSGPGIEVTVDWEKVDKLDAVVDVVGLVGEAAGSFAGTPGRVVFWGSTALEITDTVIGGVSLAKGVFDATYDVDPTNLLIDVIQLAIDGSRAAPVSGWFFNLLSLGLNIGPHISVNSNP